MNTNIINGEYVGIIAGESFAQPLTSINLDSFHRRGRICVNHKRDNSEMANSIPKPKKHKQKEVTNNQ